VSISSCWDGEDEVEAHFDASETKLAISERMDSIDEIEGSAL
jgi:hypothetical protein